MKIRTSNTGGGEYAWSAIDDDTYDGAEDSANRLMIGFGATEQEAIDGLKRLQRERNDFSESPEHATAMTVTATVSAISDLAVFSLKNPDELTADLGVLLAAHELLGVALERLSIRKAA